MSYLAPPPGTVVEIRRAQPHSVHPVIDRGVVLHPAMTWLVAYFPGSPERPADPGDPSSIRVLRTADVTAYRAMADCEPEWVVRTWNHLQTSSGFLQAPAAVAVWEIAAALARHRLDSDAAELITREQLECWAGRPLTVDDLSRLDEAIPCSSIPEAIGAIVEGMDHH